MAQIDSRNSGHRNRQDMTGKLADHYGVTFVFVDGQPALRLSIRADSGRDWFVHLDASETTKLFAGCDQVRTLKPPVAA